MGIVWLALKILICIMLLFFILFLLLLAAPFEYRIICSKYETIKGKFSVGWLFGALKAEGIIESKDDIKLRVKLFGIKLFGKRKTRKTEQSSDTKTEPPEAEFSESQNMPLKKPEKPVSEKAEDTAKTVPLEAKGEVRRIKISKTEETSFEEETKNEGIEKETEEKSESEPEDKEFDLKSYFLKMPWEEKKTIARALLKFLKKALKNILPGYSKVSGVIGLEDPCDTGLVLGAIWALGSAVGIDIDVSGNFSESELSGEIALKGRVVAGVFVTAAFELIFTKPIWESIKKIWKVTVKKNGKKHD